LYFIRLKCLKKLHEYFEIADNCLIKIIKGKHAQIQDTFENLGNLGDDVIVIFSHINAMRIITKEMVERVRKNLIKIYLVRRKQRKRQNLISILSEIKFVKDNIVKLCSFYEKGKVSESIEIYNKIQIALETKLSKLKICSYFLNLS